MIPERDPDFHSHSPTNVSWFFDHPIVNGEIMSRVAKDVVETHYPSGIPFAFASRGIQMTKR